MSRCSSKGSFTGGFNIDWDEIDSIAEESLSVGTPSHPTVNKRRSSKGKHIAIDDDDCSFSSYSSRHSSGYRNNKIRRQTSHGSLRGMRRERTDSYDSLFGFELAQRQRRNNIFRFWRNISKKVGKTTSMAILLSLMCMTGGTLKYSFNVLFQSNNIGSPKPVNPNDPAYIDNERQMRRSLAKQTNTYTSRPWPVSVRDEEKDFEFMVHPANPNVTLSIPKFYLSDQKDGSMQTLSKKLPTRSIVDMIGRSTGIEPGQLRSSSVMAEEMRTIFIGIASYRDSLCRYTVESAFAKARYPERLRIGVVDQLLDGDQSCDVPLVDCNAKPNQALCKYRNQIDVYEMEAALAVGAPFARHIVNRLYRGEYYALQIDAHVQFVQDWDIDIVSQIVNTKNEMAVVTNYLSSVSGSIDSVTGRSLRVARQVICNAAYEGSGPDRRLRHDAQSQPEALSPIHGSPALQPYWASGFSFSRGHFILRVPYDPYLPMVTKQDEEISMALRAFSMGYDFYTPERSVCFNSASDNPGAKRKSFLQHKHLYTGHETASLKRLYGLIGMDPDENDPEDFYKTPKELFGCGKVRDVSKFFSTFGIHIREKITERKLCDYVSTGSMHKKCSPFLRNDGMGVDYNQIHFRFHELQNNHDNGR